MKAILIMALLGFGCADYSEETAETKSDARPNQESWRSRAVFSTNGIIDADLTFGHMLKWESRQLTTFNEGLRLEFYEKGNHTAYLTCDSGEILSNSNNFTALGHVVIVSDSGVSMRTDKIYWNHEKQRIYADGLVTMTTENDTLMGYQFESNKDLTNWKMKHASGRSARDIDLRTGTVKSRPASRTKEEELDREMKEVLKK